ncbi:hypothetical protein DCC39_00290 [Pueribacillus theae]|uniref:Uncharacterized protein n=1 Tax=Pueribacillus theae TaxID=2171751 RepID=A0A2U1K764_9BACI|nr:hypothetical protein [Pueribacillus theae]PWA13367.1 hypothetical protein DCC39_00290 [Pueribacillus theae]
MKQVIQTLRRKDAEERLPVLHLELNYELATLYDAMVENDEAKINESKEKLESLRRELIRLEV